MAEINFNIDEAPEDDSLLPAGDYVLIIESSEVKKNETKGTQRLAFTMTVAEGPLTNRKCWPSFNLWHSGDAGKIAHAEFAKLCRAAGLSGAVKDSEELHNKAVRAKVTINGDWNRYKFRPLGTATPPAAKPSGDAPANETVAAGTGGDSKPPWAR